MKHKVRLRESDINRIVRQSVNRILQEVTMNGKTSPYRNDFATDNRIAAHGYTHNSANMPDPSYDGIKKGDYYAAPNRDSSSMHKDIDNFNKKQKKNTKAADKRWQKAADSRPLNRKGSTNRAFKESRIRGIVRESIKRVLNEDFDGFDNDLDYNNIYDEAEDFIYTNDTDGMSWRDIAEGMGFRMESIGPNDMETLKDAIEGAMAGGYDHDEDDLITNWGDNNYDI